MIPRQNNFYTFVYRNIQIQITCHDVLRKTCANSASSKLFRLSGELFRNIFYFPLSIQKSFFSARLSQIYLTINRKLSLHNAVYHFWRKIISWSFIIIISLTYSDSKAEGKSGIILSTRRQVIALCSSVLVLCISAFLTLKRRGKFTVLILN